MTSQRIFFTVWKQSNKIKKELLESTFKSYHKNQFNQKETEVFVTKIFRNKWRNLLNYILQWKNSKHLDRQKHLARSSYWLMFHSRDIFCDIWCLKRSKCFSTLSLFGIIYKMSVSIIIQKFSSFIKLVYFSVTQTQTSCVFVIKYYHWESYFPIIYKAQRVVTKVRKELEHRVPWTGQSWNLYDWRVLGMMRSHLWYNKVLTWVLRTQ
jgi:hypothetical protein